MHVNDKKYCKAKNFNLSHKIRKITYKNTYKQQHNKAHIN